MFKELLIIIFIGVIIYILLVQAGTAVFAWIIAPLNKRREEKEANDTDKQTIIIEAPTLNTSKIVAYKPKDKQPAKKFIYRPQSLFEYIGQDKAKQLLKLNVKKIKELKPVHILISGNRGCGKTTLAHIIKNMLGAKMIERVAGEIQNPDDIINIINEINTCQEEWVVLFLDEVHALEPELCEVFYPIMEDFKISGKAIKPFILIGATTEKNVLMKKVSPFVDRFGVQLELERYTEENIVEILTQYKAQLYADKPIPEINLKYIAKNCRATPRVAITLMEDNIIESNISKVIKYHRIVKDGITETDVAILEVLKQNSKPVGANALAQIVGISQADYQDVYESFLCEQGLILRTSRGRILSDKGIQLLDSLKTKVGGVV